MSYIKELQSGLRELLKDKNTFLIGEDIAEPYGGAFKVSKGFSDEFPAQIINTPMSEQGFTGMGIGMALAGLNVMVEIMFGDFVTLCADQLINHASKFVGLYNRKLHFVLRTPMGGYRGYGATHSQSLEKLFLGIPDLYLVSPSIVHNPGNLIKESLGLGMPVVFIENKLDYTRYMLYEQKDAEDYEIKYSGNQLPIAKIQIVDEDESDVLILCYGGILKDAVEVQKMIYFEEELSVHVIAPSLIYPIQEEFIDKAMQYESVIILEEGYGGGSWGAEISACLSDKGYKGKIKRISASLETIGAAESLENATLPSSADIVNAIVEVSGG